MPQAGPANSGLAMIAGLPANERAKKPIALLLAAHVGSGMGSQKAKRLLSLLPHLAKMPGCVR